MRRATNATRVGSAPPFREKVDENNSGFAVENSSPNQNLKNTNSAKVQNRDIITYYHHIVKYFYLCLDSKENRWYNYSVISVKGEAR